MMVAANATAASSAGKAAKVPASVALTPKSRLAITRVKTAAPARPAAMPMAASSIPYIGLLGPAVRREKLMADLGHDARALQGRLHAPVGLPLGGRSPESIALAIVAQLHSFLHRGMILRDSAPSVFSVL